MIKYHNVHDEISGKVVVIDEVTAENRWIEEIELTGKVALATSSKHRQLKNFQTKF